METIHADAISQIQLEDLGGPALAWPTDGATVNEAAGAASPENCEDAFDGELANLCEDAFEKEVASLCEGASDNEFAGLCEDASESVVTVAKDASESVVTVAELSQLDSAG